MLSERRPRGLTGRNCSSAQVVDIIRALVVIEPALPDSGTSSTQLPTTRSAPTRSAHARRRMATCPECDAEIEVDEFDVDKGDQLSCPECGSNLEVIAMSPLELDLAPDD